MRSRKVRYLCSDVGRESQRNTQVKYRYMIHLLKYSNEIFVLGSLPPLDAQQIPHLSLTEAEARMVESLLTLMLAILGTSSSFIEL